MKLRITQKANNYTYFINKFRKNGKVANKFLDIAKKENYPIWQRVFKDGSIGLKPEIKGQDSFIFIKPDGSIIKKANNYIIKLWKRFSTYLNKGLIDKIITKERFYANNRLEEIGIREYNKGGPVLNTVTSYNNRMFKFPQTSTGKNMHNFNIKRVRDEYGEFHMQYNENYQYT